MFHYKVNQSDFHDSGLTYHQNALIFIQIGNISSEVISLFNNHYWTRLAVIYLTCVIILSY